MIHTIETVSLIEEIKTDGHSPMKFICSDGNIYYVKYRSGKSFNKNELVFLLYEMLCSQLLQSLHIPTPLTTLIRISEGSFNSENLKVNRRYTKSNIIAFGSREIPNSQLITDFEVIKRKQDFQKILNPLDLIRIALFDWWVDNNDRGKSLKIGGFNYNLLLSPSNNKKQIIAFDHAFTFGGEQSIGLFLKNLPISPINKLPNSSFFLSLIDFLDRESMEITVVDFIEKCKNLAINHILMNLEQSIPTDWYALSSLSQKIEDFLTDSQRLSSIEIAMKNSLKI
jgi:hypothetical protein